MLLVMRLRSEIKSDKFLLKYLSWINSKVVPDVMIRTSQILKKACGSEKRVSLCTITKSSLHIYFEKICEISLLLLPVQDHRERSPVMEKSF